eukprot:4300776-Amphidinium_carterae.1
MERPRGRARRGFSQEDPVVSFGEEGVSAISYCEALEQVEQIEAQVLTAERSGLVGDGDWMVGCSTHGELVGKKLDEKVIEKVQMGDLALVYTLSGTSLVAREPMVFEGVEGDARVLPVKWKGSARRRPFQEAVEMMESNEYGDEEMEGEMSCLWFLEKICATGLDPVARHRAWVTDSNIPAGDRSVYEHHMISLVLQTAATRDQLNLGSLLCMEMLSRNGLHAKFMGLGDLEQRGGALVNPGLLKLAASKASERTQILKERRKIAEELRLRKNPGAPKGKGDGKNAGGAKE